MSDKETKPEDWPEDFGHENGRYVNICGDCARAFFGHKRRVTCNLCAQAPPPPSETELREALGKYEFAIRHFECCECESMPCDHAVAYRAARSSLESLYRDLEIDNERLRGECSGWQDLTEHAERELSALRSLQLTVDEARIVYNRLQDKSSPTIPRAVLWDATDKLRKRGFPQ